MVVYPALNSTSCLEHFKMLGWLLYTVLYFSGKESIGKKHNRPKKKKCYQINKTKTWVVSNEEVWTKQENMYEPGNMKATQLYDSSTIPVE